MRPVGFWFPLFFLLIIGLSVWRQKALRRLPDAERLKIMDYQNRIRVGRFVPLLIAIVIMTWAIPRFSHSGPRFFIACIGLMGASVLWNTYANYRGLAALGISPGFLRAQKQMALLSCLLLAGWFGYLAFVLLRSMPHR